MTGDVLPVVLQVVLMNQVTTKVLDDNRGSKLVPALGIQSVAVHKVHIAT